MSTSAGKVVRTDAITTRSQPNETLQTTPSALSRGPAQAQVDPAVEEATPGSALQLLRHEVI